MHPREINLFRKLISGPIEKKVFDAVELKEGMGFVDSIEVRYLDGRNCGFDSQIIVSGLELIDGKVQSFNHEAYDESLNEVLSTIKYPYISRGAFIITDELREIEIKTRLFNAAECNRIFSESDCMNGRTYLGNSAEYWKMAQIISSEHEDAQDDDISEDEELIIGGMQQ